MSEENDTGKHEFNFFLDKQIQQKLLEADEVIAAKETALYGSLSAKFKGLISGASNSNSSNVNGTSKNNNLSKPLKEKDSSRVTISGWCSGPDIVYRKTESDIPVKTRGPQGFRDTYSRDSRFRPQTHNPQDFVFRHYADPRRYIEQYRKEHTCYDTTTTSAARSEFLETRRFYAYNQYSPLAVGTQNNAPSVNGPLSSPYQEAAIAATEQALHNQKKQQQAPILQYTNRREQTKQTISANLRPTNIYKLSKSNTSTLEKAKTPDSLQETSSLHDRDGQVKRAGSARGSASPGVNGISLQRNPAITTSEMDRLSSRGHKSPVVGIPTESNIAGQFLGRKLGQVVGASGQTRTLDSLACQAVENGGGKQISGVQATVGSGAIDTSYAEARLEQLRRINRQLLAPAAPSVPQLRLIREGEVSLIGRADDTRSTRAGKGRNFKGRRGDPRELSESLRKVDERSSCGSVVAFTFNSDSGGDGGSITSSLHPNDGSSVRTSLGSYTGSCSSGGNNNSSNYFNTARTMNRACSADGLESKKMADKHLQDKLMATSHVLPTSTASLSSVPTHVLSDQYPSLSWRERMQLQQKKVTSSGDAPCEKDVFITRRWALASQQEELSSLAHAQRIKHLIEESRQRGGAGVGLKLERSISEDGGQVQGREEDISGLKALRVEGQQHKFKRPTRIPPATTTSCGRGKGVKPIPVKGDELQTPALASSHTVLPPVAKTQVGSDVTSSIDIQMKSQAQDVQGTPALGNLLDTQTFFSHGLPHASMGSNTTCFKHRTSQFHNTQQQQQQKSRAQVPEKQQPPQLSLYEAPLRVSPGLSTATSNATAGALAATNTIATVQVMGEPGRPRLKYSSNIQHRLMGGCSP